MSSSLKFMAPAMALVVTASAPSFANESSSMVLEEVIVTSERRSANVQDTSIAISVMDSAKLKDNGVSDITEIANFSPSLDVNTRGTSNNIAIRGVMSSDVGAIADPAVAFNVDGVYVQRSAGNIMYDLERVEVLRGPQGSLYGRNATAGAINVVTAKPGKEFEASVSADLGSYSKVKTEGMINLPLTDQLSFRAAFLNEDRDGFRDNGPWIDEDGDDADNVAVRAHLLYEPIENLSMLFTAEYTRREGVGRVGAQVNTYEDDAREFPLNTESEIDLKGNFYRFEVAYDFDWGTLKYIGSYKNHHQFEVADTDGSANFNLMSRGTTSYTANSESETETHEISLGGENEKLTWQAGMFYLHEDLIDLDQLIQAAPGLMLFNFNYPDTDITSKAIFGQASYNLREDIRVTIGGRYSEDEKSRKGAQTMINFGPFGPMFGSYTVIPQNKEGEWNATTWSIGLDWFVLEDSMLYAKVGTGYKSGGFNELSVYDEENVLAYEIGAKNRFWGGQVQLNAALFYYDFDDQQVSQFIQNVGEVISNAGESEVTGLEIELEMMLEHGGRLDFGLTYLDTQYGDVIMADSHGDNQNVEGHPLLFSAEWGVALGYEYSWTLPAAELTARLQSRYQSETTLDPFDTEVAKQDAYTKTDALLTYNDDEGDWRVQAYVKNIEGESTRANISRFAGPDVYFFSAPRTYGVRLIYNW